MAIETCSRKAIINYQEVLVDTSTNKRGEGLRYFLSKNKESERLLNEYQNLSKPSLRKALLSTLGSTMLLSGLLLTNDNENNFLNKTTLTVGGAFVIVLSYLTTKTIQYKNEAVLERAVQNYNQNEKPTIYFSPYIDSQGYGGSIGVSQEF